MKQGQVKQPEPRPGVEVGDEVYFHHADGPRSGKVVAHGRHGCTIKADDAHHKVPWKHLLGHKKRAPQQYRVVEEGDDGMIVEDKAGRRRFIAVPPEAREEQMIVKSSDGGGRLVQLVRDVAPAPREEQSAELLTKSDNLRIILLWKAGGMPALPE